MNIELIQQALRDGQIDGWLFFDHHQRDLLAYRILGLQPPRTVTRRWYYLIPASGEPRGLVHRIESGMLDALAGPKDVYSSWEEQRAGLGKLLDSRRRIAMQYSPLCAIPYVSMVDAGTLELVRSFGVEVVTSADLVQTFEAAWNEANLEAHLEAGRLVDGVRAAAFELAAGRVRSNARFTEWELAEWIRGRFREAGLFTDHGPIVAVNKNAANPHYEPQPERDTEIKRGDLLLIDMWAKLDRPEGVYYDITWTGFLGPEPPPEMDNVFDIVRGARDAAIQRVTEAVAQGVHLRGFEVDDAARGYIRERGFGDRFVHRTGHSIGADVHGAGANMDNLETHDERGVIPWTCFSIEPGIYLENFGIRSEVNVFVDETAARVTGARQDALLRLL